MVGFKYLRNRSYLKYQSYRGDLVHKVLYHDLATLACYPRIIMNHVYKLIKTKPNTTPVPKLFQLLPNSRLIFIKHFQPFSLNATATSKMILVKP